MWVSPDVLLFLEMDIFLEDNHIAKLDTVGHSLGYIATL